jgi:hypothetical protein
MLNARSFAPFAAAVAIVAAVAEGPGPVVAQMTPDTVEADVRCQTNIANASRKFATIKRKALEQCVDLIVGVALRYEAGAITEAQAEAAVAVAERRCARHFGQIENASTVLINKIVDACQPVEPLVVGYDDALRFRAGGFGGGFVGSNVTELAGHLCAVNEVFVDASVFANVPLVEELGFTFQSIPVDPRCTVPDPSDD